MTARDIIIKPIITEKSMAGVATEKKYTFKVDKKATKIQIAKAVEEIFGVNSWKKAYVTLTEKSKTIEFFEGMM